MLVLLSPSKTLDLESPVRSTIFTKPDFLPDSEKLIERMKKYSRPGIARLMKVSDKIAALNYERFRSWQLPFTPDNSRQAVFAFKGDVYTGLDVSGFSAADIKYGQKHLRIISGLYGLLRPLDLIQPYRLEMGTRFDAGSNGRSRDNLYKFWDDRITTAVNQALVKQNDNILVNLASNEYFKAVKPEQLKGQLVLPAFKQYKNGDYKMIALFAKRARGLMAQFIIRNQIENLDDLKRFDLDGYSYNKKFSEDWNWVFTRK